MKGSISVRSSHPSRLLSRTSGSILQTRSEFIAGTMLVNWLAGRPSNKFYALQKSIDELHKTLESLEQKEKVSLLPYSTRKRKHVTWQRRGFTSEQLNIIGIVSFSYMKL
ncbi:unnamed protein product [Arabidopsis thaliana]|uniref:Uncharacterized protein n=1 Tax=Arabidopsis thaliana TaxID=3702 RepID=A0A654FGD2_ARATH|nr:unnamed protein product [Arabidopsis thaliana]